MKRIIPRTDQEPVDLLIVGGGIYGSSMAYFGALNNLKVALVEKDDFCSHTSANSQKVIHGGLRYLQSFDFKRVIESIRERQRFYALFPHLVQPLPCVLPLSGWGTRSREAMGAAFFIYNLLQKLVCRKELTPHLDKVPRLLSVEKVMKMFPRLKTDKLRGAALWYDGLCVEPERLVISLLKSAALRGATVANHAVVKKITRTTPSTLSVLVRDRLSDRDHEIITRKVALCTGPWFKNDLGPEPISAELSQLSLIAGTNVVTRQLNDADTSIALKSKKRRNSGLLFVVPWKKWTISGTRWEDGGDLPQHADFQSEVCEQLIRDVHDCYPTFDKMPTVTMSHFGYVPGDSDTTKEPAKRILSHYLFVDREKASKGDILQIVGVKFTTALDVSLKALAKLFPNNQFADTVSPDSLPVGSPVEKAEVCLQDLQEKYNDTVSSDIVTLLFSLFGTELVRIFDEYIFPVAEVSTKIGYDDILAGVTRFFIQEEMVLSLVDLIFNRLYPGMPRSIEKKELDIIAREMALLLSWSPEHLEKEMKTVEQRECLKY